jgi:hypothetical protein
VPVALPRLVSASTAVAAAVALGAVGCGGTEKEAPFDDGHGAVAVANTTERLDYPAPPYGATVGATIENFRFLGWEDPKAAAYGALESHSLAEFYDPNGEKGIHYVLVTSTAVWCSACRLEYQDMHSKVSTYEARGARFLGALFEDQTSNPAQPSDLKDWAQTFDVRFPFMLDPDLKLGSFFDVEATPLVMIIDTKTMKIAKIDAGWLSSGDGSAWGFFDAKLPPAK